jgi:flagellar hook protein FlgE
MEASSGGTFTPTDDSGTVVLEEPGQRGAGKVLESTLEGSNADIAAEFTKMIIAQRGYQSNARIITVADELLQELNNI